MSILFVGPSPQDPGPRPTSVPAPVHPLPGKEICYFPWPDLATHGGLFSLECQLFYLLEEQGKSFRKLRDLRLTFCECRQPLG